jgi:toxin ParE1/3/4
MKPARLRPAAKTDLTDLAMYYAETGGASLGQTFVDTALNALGVLADQPGIGSPRWSSPGQLPVLRSWRLGRFPALWFYLERADHIDVARLLGERQDIAALLGSGLD